MRIIDVDRITSGEIAKYLGRGYEFCAPDIEDMLREQPTAFDMAKVVRELKKLKMRYYMTIANTGDTDKDCAYLNIANAIDKAIEIVKRGGLNETK